MRTGQRRDAQVTLQRYEFRLARGPREAEPAGKQALVHHAVDGKIWVARLK